MSKKTVCFYLQGSQKRYVVTDSYEAQNTEELTVHKGDLVCLVHRDKKSSSFYTVRSLTKEDTGLVPSKILHKTKDKHGDGDGIKRTSSFG